MAETVERFILMRHDPEGRNLAYLYEAYASVVDPAGIGTGRAAIDIVRIQADNEDRADFTANYQLGRLHSGMEGRSDLVFKTLDEATAEAERVTTLLSGLV